MIDISALYLLLFGVFVLVLVAKRKRPTLPYPPGPNGYPVLGNVLDLTISVPLWEDITSLADRYAPDDYVAVVRPERHSTKFLSQPLIFVARTGASEWLFAAMPYGAPWRARRRLCYDALNVRLTGSFDNHQYKYVHRFLSHLLEEPKRFIQELEFTPGAIIMSITYGIDIKSVDDRFLNANLEASHAIAAAMVPGKFLVGVIPMLRHIPDWFTGTGFKALAKEAGDKFRISVDGPFEYAKSAMKSGEGVSQSIASDCLSRLEDREQTGFDGDVIRDVSGVMFTAAAETVDLEGILFSDGPQPEAMRKAQEELDRVVGKGELPDLSHKDNLPYIDALVKEVLRWNPPLPISLPNRAMQDDVYRGRLIPAGTIVIQNVWAIYRDPSIYPDPETFNPDRFLKDGKIDPSAFNLEDRVFGAGRRACLGKNLALRTVYLVVASVLSVFDIGPVSDDDGNPRMPKPEFDDATIRGPRPFECIIRPRSEDAMKLVKEIGDR